MHSVNWLFKYLNGIRSKNRYERLTKAENAKAVRVPRNHVPLYVGKEEKRYDYKFISLIWSGEVIQLQESKSQFFFAFLLCSFLSFFILFFFVLVFF
jgi:hypothetical protein